MAPTPDPLPAAGPRLVLFTRRGCCLCEGLEERLRALALLPGVTLPALDPVDVDGEPRLQARYGLEVPVLALRDSGGSLRELPRVPPRLAGGQLATWLEKQGVVTRGPSGSPPA
jgi:hypothetical protein